MASQAENTGREPLTYAAYAREKTETIVPAFVGLGGGVSAAIGMERDYNQPNVYNPLHRQVVYLQHEAAGIATIARHSNVLGAYSGKQALEAYLHKQHVAVSREITTLEAKEPNQLSGIAEVGITGSLALVGAALGVALMRGIRRL